MDNKEFYEKLILYETNGQIVFMPQTIENDYLRLQVGKKVLAIHLSVVEFAREIKKRVRDHDFFTQAMLESYLNRTDSYIRKAVKENEYVKLTRGSNVKFYIKKDWED